MRPPDPQDPELAAFLRGSSERIAAIMRARGADLPPAALEQFARVVSEHLRAHPRDNTFYNMSGSRLVAIVSELERELPGGQTNPSFNEALATKLRDILEGQGQGPNDPAASA